jgi:nitric oxide reductase subunit B
VVGVPLSAPPSDPGAVSPRDAASRAYATRTFVRGALVSAGLALTAGLLAALHYLPGVSPVLARLGLGFPALRPLHTTFAAAWIFLGGIALVHRYLEDQAGPMAQAERWRLRLQVVLWAVAGAAILVSLPLGVTSGREYMGFHPLISIPILVGWLLFVWSFFRATWRGFWSRPVYVTMWAVGCLFFPVTFLEQHAWLLPDVFEQPVRDLRLQWKACGTLVGSFNLFVYGGLLYVGEKLSGDERYARSRLAYALLFVGLLNSFTNFTHHTYHLPQTHTVKWIGFVVSMSELVILARVVWDLAGRAQAAPSQHPVTVYFLGVAKWWTGFMLASSLLLSVPPLNAVVHGTWVVTGHAMGTEVGIDSMILFGGLAWLLLPHGSSADEASGLRWGRLLNLAAAGLVIWLHLIGTLTGVARATGAAPPGWVITAGPIAFVGLGALVALSLAALLSRWIPLAFARRALPASDA